MGPVVGLQEQIYERALDPWLTSRSSARIRGSAAACGTRRRSSGGRPSALGRTPELLYLRYRRSTEPARRSLRGSRRRGRSCPGSTRRTSSPLRPDRPRHPARLARGSCARQSPRTASAPRSPGRPYGCWVGDLARGGVGLAPRALDGSRAGSRSARAPRCCGGSSAPRSAAPCAGRSLPTSEARRVAAAAGLPETAVRIVADPDRHRSGSARLPDEEWEARLATPQLVLRRPRRRPAQERRRSCSTPSRGSGRALPAARLTLVGAPPRRPAARRRRGGWAPSRRSPSCSARDAPRPSVAPGGLRDRRRRGARGRGAGARDARAAGRRSSCAPRAAARCSRASTADELADALLALLGETRASCARCAAAAATYVVREHDPARFATRSRAASRSSTWRADVAVVDRQPPGRGRAARLPREPRDQTAAPAR